MEPLFDWCEKDITILLPYVKTRLMSGNAQNWIAEKLLKFLQSTRESERAAVVGKFVKFDIISTICDVVQTSDESFVKIILECFEITSGYKEFYENQAAMTAIQTMLRVSYCVNKSLKDSTLFERLVQGASDILVRSLKLDVNFDTGCILQQIVLFVKNLNIKDLQKNKLKFAAVAMLNVVLQKQVAFDESIDAEMITDVCYEILMSMKKIVKCGEDDETILFAVDSLCGTCASSSRFCLALDSSEETQTEKIYNKRESLEICVYNTMMDIIIPYVKDKILSSLDLIRFYKNLTSCLNNLYLIKNCNMDNLSTHLAANGYLERFLLLIVQYSENLQRSTSILLSRILSILGKTAFSIDTTEFANILHQCLLKLSKDSTKWSDAVAHKKDGSALIILLYYHYLGTGEISKIISLEPLITRVMLLPKSTPISTLILKPLWLLFAVTSLSHQCPYLIYHYTNAVDRLTNILEHSEISEFYTHHVDLLSYCLKCPNISQDFLNRILSLWLIESDGDIKPLSANYTKVVEYLLVVIRTNCPKRIVNVALKGFHCLMQIVQGDGHLTDDFAHLVWRILPDILSSYQPDAITHIETSLELANMIQPSMIPLSFIIRSADNIADIILKMDANSKFMTLILTQAYILLDTATSRNSFEVLETYVKELRLLKQLSIYGFSKERSELATAGIKLLAFIIYCQKKSSVKCEMSLTIKIKTLFELLTDARKSPCCILNGMQFMCELLTSNNDGSAVVLENITTTADKMCLMNIFEFLHIIHAQKDPISQDMVHRSLVTLLDFCNTKAAELMLPLCTTMSTYDLIFDINMQRPASCHFDKFILTWLNYRKATGDDVPWNPKALYKMPFDEVLDKLKEYLVVLNNEATKGTYQKLQSALSQFE